MLNGRCLCGEVRFIVEDSFAYAFYCYCSRCRLRTGSAFASIGGIAIDKVQVTLGREHLLIEDESSDGYGVRCSKCHTFLFPGSSRQKVHTRQPRRTHRCSEPASRPSHSRGIKGAMVSDHGFPTAVRRPT
jgi:hypothetical protein